MRIARQRKPFETGFKLLFKFQYSIFSVYFHKASNNLQSACDYFGPANIMAPAPDYQKKIPLTVGQ